MAKRSMIERDVKRKRLVKANASKRARLKQLLEIKVYQLKSVLKLN